ncbi:MAG: DUF5615 family PIN-like protein [Planctomycetes bacterium]|nr:DUF5615 family PIN-like protein [Planctomycetota bacterium]
MARLYADEHFPMPIVHRLRRLGDDVRTVRQDCVDKQGDAIPDELVLQEATRQNRVLVTCNRFDFQRLHAEKPGHRGILAVVLTQDVKKLARLIHEVAKRRLDGQFIVVKVPSENDPEPRG